MRYWDIAESRTNKYLTGHISGNNASPLAEVADSEASWHPLSVHVFRYGPKQSGRGDQKLLFVWLDFRARKSKVCCTMLAPLESSALVDYETPLIFADRLSGC